jgi:hypothetical protein
LESYPTDYAMTQDNLGNAYAILAEVRDKEENLESSLKIAILLTIQER